MDGLVLLTGVALCAGVLALVVFSSAAMPDSLACARVRVPGGREPGFRARYATGSLRGLSVLPLVSVITAGVALTGGVGGLATRWRVVGALAAVLCTGLLAYRGRGGATRHFYLALTPSGLVLRPSSCRAFVPWDAVADVVMLGNASETARLGLTLHDRCAVDADPWDRARLRLRRPKNADIAVRLDDLDTDPRAFVHAATYYLHRADRRRSVGTPAELEHLHAVQELEIGRRR